MDNRLVYSGFIQNTGQYNITVTSPDIKQIDGAVIPANTILPFQISLPPNLKLLNKELIDSKNKLIGIYVTVVDIEF